MSACPKCRRLRFATCRIEGHGEWCVPCTGAMSCPACAAPRVGSVFMDFLVLLTILGFGALALWTPYLLDGAGAG